MSRLELTAVQVAAKLMDSARQALSNHHITKFFDWADNTVVLQWNREENGKCKQLISNIVGKIEEKEYISWEYFPTKENCVEVGSNITILNIK